MQFSLVRSRRKTVAIEITPGGTVIVRAPLYTPESRINAFLQEKSFWIEKHLKKIREREILPRYTEKEIREFTARSKEFLPEKVERFAREIKVTYGKIGVRRAKTVWGSCTLKGNLNFNCLISALPTEIADYIVIHELCHRIYMNHSRKFWEEVKKYCPDYIEQRRWLKTRGAQYLNRV